MNNPLYRAAAKTIMKQSEIDKAKKLLERALAEGAIPSLSENWVEWTGPMSTELLIDLTMVDGSALVEVVSNHLLI